VKSDLEHGRTHRVGEISDISDSPAMHRRGTEGHSSGPGHG